MQIMSLQSFLFSQDEFKILVDVSANNGQVNKESRNVEWRSQDRVSKIFQLGRLKCWRVWKKEKEEKYNLDGQEQWLNSYYPLPPNAYRMTEKIDNHMAKLYQDKWRFNDNKNDCGKYEKILHFILWDSNISLATAKNSSRATLRKINTTIYILHHFLCLRSIFPSFHRSLLSTSQFSKPTFSSVNIVFSAP